MAIIPWMLLLQSPEGYCLWIKNAGTTATAYSSGITLDPNNNCYITGYFWGSVIFGNNQLTSSGGCDMFMAKYDSDGTVLWARKEAGTANGYSDYDKSFGIAADTLGNTYILGTTPAPGRLNSYIYLAKYNSTGTRLWEKYEPGGEESYHYGICTDGSGNLIIAGTFEPFVKLGSFVLVSSGSSDIFIAKYDPNGVCLWATRGGGVNNDDALCIAADKYGFSTCTGHFTGTTIFGNTQLTACGGGTEFYDGFVIRYDPNGTCLWAKQIASTGYDSGEGVFVDNNSNSFISGYYHTYGYFGDIILSGPGEYIAKMPPHPTPIELISFSAYNKDNNVTLNWTTVTELNNQGFEIQRKLISGEFVTIGFVQGNGTSSEVKTYIFQDKNLPSGKYLYRLKQIDYNGTPQLSDIVEVTLMDRFSLNQNYPNPFNPETKITYSLPLDCKVSLILYDVLGREIVTLANELKTTGEYSIIFNASNLASGIYIYKLKANDFITSKKMVVAK